MCGWLGNEFLKETPSPILDLSQSLGLSTFEFVKRNLISDEEKLDHLTKELKSKPFEYQQIFREQEYLKEKIANVSKAANVTEADVDFLKSLIKDMKHIKKVILSKHVQSKKKQEKEFNDKKHIKKNLKKIINYALRKEESANITFSSANFTIMVKKYN